MNQDNPLRPSARLGNIKERIIVNRMLQTSVIGLAVFLLAFTLIPNLIAEASAKTAQAKIDWGSVFLTLDPDKAATDAAADKEAEMALPTHGDINFGTIMPTSRTENNSGTMVVKKKTIGITSSGTYYTVYVSTNDVSSNGLNMVSTVDGATVSSTSYQIPAVTGTWANPASLTAAASWGIAVPGTTIASTEKDDNDQYITPSFPVPSIIDDAIYNATDISSSAYQTYNNTRWASVPVRGSAQQIWKASTNNPNGFGTYLVGDETKVGDQENNTFDIYYAVMVDTDIISGVYQNEVIYTALASASSLDQVSSNLVADREFGGKGDEIELIFDLTDSTASVTESMVTVAMVPHNDIYDGTHYIAATNDYDLSSLDYSSYDQCRITGLSRPADNSYISLTCLVPNKQPGEEYDFWVKVSGYNYDYVSKSKITSGNSQTAAIYPAFTYAGLQSTYPTTDPRYSSEANADNHYAKYMQDMTVGICNLTNAWGNTTSLSAQTETDEDTGEEVTTYSIDTSLVHLYDHTGGGTEITTNVNKNGLADGVGTFELIDNRDNKTYLTRRLADGNCWMVQNLDLDLASIGTLTPEKTDVSADWNPYGKVAQDAFSTWSEENLGIAQTHQYQPYGTSGNNYHWGSRLNESGVLLDGTNGSDGNSTMAQIGSTGIYVENNSKSEIARSYDNGSDWINNIATSNADGTSDDYKTSGTPTSPTEYIGDYYNWYAATAESGTYAMASGNASSSICPFGWQLPVNGATNDKSWGKLLEGVYQIASESNLGSYQTRSFPLAIIPQGRYSITGGIGYHGRTGYYWSSTALSSVSANYLYVPSTYVHTESENNKTNGLSIRCVAHGSELNSAAAQEAIASETTCSANKICYDANGGSGTMTDQNANANASVTLTAPSFVRTGYAFAGWSTQDNGFGSVYGPNETITAPSTQATSGLRLYAKWLPAERKANGDVLTMQEFDATACENLGMHQTIALTDSRDGNVYTVAKLKDNNCWMTSNLALNLADFAGHNLSNTTDPNKVLTPNNTDLNSTDAVTRGYWDPSESMRTLAEEILMNNRSFVEELAEEYPTYFDTNNLAITQNNYFLVASKYRLGTAQTNQFQSGDQYGANWHWGSKCMETEGVVSCDDTVEPQFSTALIQMPRQYYSPVSSKSAFNWFAATAEDGKYSTIATVNDSICPKGWNLPIDGGTSTTIDYSWGKLLSSLDTYALASGAEASRTVRKTPISFVTPYLYRHVDGSLQGTGNYWTATAVMESRARYLTFSTSELTVSKSSLNKPDGMGIRCVRY